MANDLAIRRALEAAGAEFIDGNGGHRYDAVRGQGRLRSRPRRNGAKYALGK